MSLCESISSIYLAAGGNLLTDSRNLPGRCCRLYAAPGFRVAGSRLSHDSDDHIGLHVTEQRIAVIGGTSGIGFTFGEQLHSSAWRVRQLGDAL
jgi:hypothetical protein